MHTYIHTHTHIHTSISSHMRSPRLKISLAGVHLPCSNMPNMSKETHVNEKRLTKETYRYECRYRWKETYKKDPQSISIQIYSPLHLECHFLSLRSQSMILFSRSLLPRSVENRPMRLGLEIGIERRFKCNRMYVKRDLQKRPTDDLKKECK